MTFEQMLPTIVIAIIGGLLGIVIKGLGSKIDGMAKSMEQFVSEKVCEARRQKIEGDVNNLGKLVRGE